MKFIILITKGLLRDTQMRRKTMFVIVLAALGMLFAGATFLAATLHDHVVAFLLYWAVCAWLTVLAVLMAIFDLLMVRVQARMAHRELHREVFPPEESDPRK